MKITEKHLPYMEGVFLSFYHAGLHKVRIRCDIHRVINMVDHHTGTASGRLFYILHRRIIHGYIAALPRLGMVRRHHGRLQQIRLRLGRATPRLFLFFTLALLGIGALSAIPVPIAFLAGVFNRSETITALPPLASVLRNPECLAGALIILGACAEAAIQSFGITEAAEIPDNTPTSPDTLEDCEEKE